MSDRSPLGPQLDRAELYSCDENGKRIPAPERNNWQLIHVHETPSHALSHANTEATEQQQEHDRMEREARSQFDALDPLAREILRLAHKALGVREREMPFPARQRKAREAGGWLFVKPVGASVLMVKSFVSVLTHDEIAAQLGLSVHQVRRRLNAMSRSLVKYAVMRGWI